MPTLSRSAPYRSLVASGARVFPGSLISRGLVRTGLFTVSPAPAAAPCPYPTTPSQRAYADARFRAAVTSSWLDGERYQYNNAAFVPASSLLYRGDVVALYNSVVSAPGYAGSPSPYLAQWVVGGSSSWPNWLWLSFPVDPRLDPYGVPAVSSACAAWQRFAAEDSGRPLAPLDVNRNPVVGPCAVWSH